MPLRFGDSKAPKFAKQLLFAGGYGRLFDHYKNGALAIVSAFRTGNDLKTNFERQWQLTQAVRQMGLGYMPIIGQWEGVEERSILIPGITKEKAKELASMFDQDAYLWASHGNWWVWGSGDDSLFASGSSLHLIGSDEEFLNFSKTKRERKFAMAASMDEEKPEKK